MGMALRASLFVSVTAVLGACASNPEHGAAPIDFRASTPSVRGPAPGSVLASVIRVVVMVRVPPLACARRCGRRHGEGGSGLVGLLLVLRQERSPSFAMAGASLQTPVRYSSASAFMSRWIGRPS